jgi:predicted nucleic acid-binding Zn ribbon protein
VTRRRRGPRQLAIAIDDLRDELAPQTLLAQVQRVWRAAVGEGIAGEAQPSTERGGVVTVACSASVWAQELELMGPEIVARLNRELGAQRVLRLRCVAVPPVGREPVQLRRKSR